MGGVAGSSQLRVNPIACTAHGLCAELLPEMITLDPWGYPIVSGEPLPAELAEIARYAAAACPVLALRIEQARRSKPPPHSGLGPPSAAATRW